MLKIAVLDNHTVVWRLIPWEPPRIRTNLIPPEARVIGLHFCRWQYGSVFIQFLWRAPNDASFLQQTAYRPFKIIQGRWFGHQSKGRMRLLVTNSNFGPTLHRFWDTASYWLKIANFSYPTLVWCPYSGGSRQNFWMKLTAQKLEGWGYCMVKIAWS